MDKKTYLKWTEALRSGKYRQTKGALQNAGGFCCLGVGCDVFIQESEKDFDNQTKYLMGELPENQPNSPVWLDKVNDKFEKLTQTELVVLNDNDGFSFDEIADLIELAFVHEAFGKVYV